MRGLRNELLQDDKSLISFQLRGGAQNSSRMTQNNSIQMSKFLSSGDMLHVKGYLHTNKMFDTIHA